MRPIRGVKLRGRSCRRGFDARVWRQILSRFAGESGQICLRSGWTTVHLSELSFRPRIRSYRVSPNGLPFENLDCTRDYYISPFNNQHLPYSLNRGPMSITHPIFRILEDLSTGSPDYSPSLPANSLRYRSSPTLCSGPSARRRVLLTPWIPSAPRYFGKSARYIRRANGRTSSVVG